MAEKKAKKEIKQEVIVSAPKPEEKYSIRGSIFEGKVVSAKANKTAVIERILTQYLPKYERYKKIKSRINAHNPESINAKEGDFVRIGETRRISKTKNFVIMEKLKGEVQKE